MGGRARTRAAVKARLTERQRDTVKTALELGYYDIPKRATQEDIAAELNCAPSTAAEHLQKAESQILRAQFARG
ncbi:helix-turn-helix domain-containing protein [Natrinema versiforme]|uniref:helix-turn-helix domain-containing protein n=1 Tax=Natrinema versiforme TaxID=88724 RepID=UPI00373AF4E1